LSVNQKSSENIHRLWGKGVEFVTHQARSLLQESGITRPPYLPEHLARLRGIRTIKEDLGNLDGLLIPLREGFQIKVNITHPPERQNFSCAHEIAHTFFFEEEGKVLIERASKEDDRQISNNLEEDLCDIAAAELLMPYTVFRQYASCYDFRIECLAPLARMFNTSIFATAVRLVDVSPKTCFLVRWIPDNSQELGNYQLCANWRISSKGVRFLFHKKFTKNSSIVEAYRSNNPTYSQECMKLGNFRGLCYIESQGFGYEPYRYVISLIFSEDYGYSKR